MEKRCSMTEISTTALRYGNIIDPDALKEPVTIVGCGAIGRQVGLQLAAFGCTNIDVWDGDMVEEVNVGTQGWYRKSIGEYKAVVLHQEMVWHMPTHHGYDFRDEFWSSGDKEHVGRVMDREAVFSCVDNMDVRKQLFEVVGRDDARCRWFFDARMGMETGWVFAVDLSDEGSRKAYEKTLFPQSEAAELPCMSRATIYNANIIAGLMVKAFAYTLRPGFMPENFKDVPGSIRVDLPRYRIEAAAYDE